jgi:hypothetical protein
VTSAQFADRLLEDIVVTAPTEFDLSAAWLRRANGDMKAFLEALAVRLNDALPSRVEVERKRDGLFSRESHAVRIAVSSDRYLHALSVDRGRLIARRSKIVRGITISSEDMAVPDWLESLNEEIRSMGDEAGTAHTILHDFLMS